MSRSLQWKIKAKPSFTTARGGGFCFSKRPALRVKHNAHKLRWLWYYTKYILLVNIPLSLLGTLLMSTDAHPLTHKIDVTYLLGSFAVNFLSVGFIFSTLLINFVKQSEYPAYLNFGLRRRQCVLFSFTVCGCLILLIAAGLYLAYAYFRN